MSDFAGLECKKHAMRQTQEGSWLVTLSLHQADVPHWLFTAPVGQRMALAELTILADETSPRSAQGSSPAPAEASGESRITPVGADRGSTKWVRMFGEKCKRKWFQEFTREFGEMNGLLTSRSEILPPEEEAACIVRAFCRVQSRTKIDGNPDAEARAQVLLNEWDAFTGRGSPRP